MKKYIKKKFKSIILSFAAFGFLVFIWQVYVPNKITFEAPQRYVVQKGWGDEDAGYDLEKKGIIKNSLFFRLYVVLSGNHAKIQAGKYLLSPSMSIAKIVGKMASGDVLRENFVVFEGYNIYDIAKIFEEKGICPQDKFFEIIKKDFSGDFDFLKNKPKDVGLEGYLFPDTYEFSEGQNAEDLLKQMIANFEKKLTPELREKIAEQKKSIFDVITMASIIEREVRGLADKKIVSGILWKRISVGMPLQVDATINYITQKGHNSALLEDLKIESPYNTYKYQGLPKGPISNPGIESIIAALEPKKTDYWYYLSGANGKTIFSSTLEEHNLAKGLYMKTRYSR